MTAIGISGIIYGRIGLAGAVYTTWRVIDLSDMFPPGVATFGLLLVSYAIQAGVVAAGVGVLKLEPFARTALLWYSGVALVWNGLSLALVGVLVLAVVLGARLDWMAGAALADSVISGLLTLPRVIVLAAGFHFLRRADVRRAFEEDA